MHGPAVYHTPEKVGRGNKNLCGGGGRASASIAGGAGFDSQLRRAHTGLGKGEGYTPIRRSVLWVLFSQHCTSFPLSSIFHPISLLLRRFAVLAHGVKKSAYFLNSSHAISLSEGITHDRGDLRRVQSLSRAPVVLEVALCYLRRRFEGKGNTKRLFTSAYPIHHAGIVTVSLCGHRASTVFVCQCQRDIMLL